MAKGMKDSTKGRGKDRAGGAKADRGLGGLQRGTGKIKREKGMGGPEQDPGEFKDSGEFGGRGGPKLGKDLPKKGCFPKLFMLSLPLIIFAAYWSLSF
jgi:hypothetical protein